MKDLKPNGIWRPGCRPSKESELSRLMRVVVLVLAGMSWLATGRAQMPDPPGQVKPGETAKCEAYLFAHMMQGDYWRLYYSVSLDGLHWDILNGGKGQMAIARRQAP